MKRKENEREKGRTRRNRRGLPFLGEKMKLVSDRFILLTAEL